jgi:hypothetical protein
LISLRLLASENLRDIAEIADSAKPMYVGGSAGFIPKQTTTISGMIVQ